MGTSRVVVHGILECEVNVQVCGSSEFKNFFINALKDEVTHLKCGGLQRIYDET